MEGTEYLHAGKLTYLSAISHVNINTLKVVEANRLSEVSPSAINEFRLLYVPGIEPTE